jgi:hypothetical protein
MNLDLVPLGWIHSLACLVALAAKHLPDRIMRLAAPRHGVDDAVTALPTTDKDLCPGGKEARGTRMSLRPRSAGGVIGWFVRSPRLAPIVIILDLSSTLRITH